MPQSAKLGLGLCHEYDAPSIIRTGLLSWWRHDEGSGSVLEDSIGGKNGSIQGGGFWSNQTPRGDPCGTYDGSNNFVKGIGTGLSVPGSDSGVTIVSAIYCAGMDANHRVIVAKGKAGSPANFNYLLYRDASTPDELRFLFTDGVDSYVRADTTDANLSASTWYIVTVSNVWGSSDMAIYVNSRECSLSSWTGNPANNPSGLNSYIQIGSNDTAGDDSGSGSLWYGRIGDVLIYNRFFLHSEIIQNYNVLKSRYNL